MILNAIVDPTTSDWIVGLAAIVTLRSIDLDRLALSPTDRAQLMGFLLKVTELPRPLALELCEDELRACDSCEGTL